MNVQLGSVTLALPSFGMIVFMSAAGLSILGGLMMITRKDAVHSALWLVLTFFQLAIMYVMLGAEFLAALQVLVYTGAIVVLFLFVIMLLGLREGPKLGGVHRGQMVAAWPVGLILALELLTVIMFSSQPDITRSIVGDKVGNTTHIYSTAEVARLGGNVQAVGQTLYTQFLLPFEVASLILLLAVVGAIVLARKEEPAEVEELMPSIGISLGRRSVSNSPQEEQLEKKLRPELGSSANLIGDLSEVEVPTVDQPSGVGVGTTSGVEVNENEIGGTEVIRR